MPTFFGARIKKRGREITEKYRMNRKEEKQESVKRHLLEAAGQALKKQADIAHEHSAA